MNKKNSSNSQTDIQEQIQGKPEVVLRSPSAVTPAEMAHKYEKMGDLFLDRNEISKVKEYYEKSCRIREKEMARSKTTHSVNNWLRMTGKLGAFYMEYGIMEDAEECFKKTLDYRKEAARQRKTLTEVNALLDAYEQMGEFYTKHGQFSKAEEFYKKSFICRKYLVYYDLDKMLQNIALFNGNVADTPFEPRVEGNKKNKKLTRTDLVDNEMDTIEINKEQRIENQLRRRIRTLIGEGQNLSEIRKLASTYEKYGDLKIAEGNVSEAQKYYSNSKDIKEMVSRETGEIRDLVVMSDIYEKYGLVYELEGKPGEARDYYIACIQIRERMVSERGTEEDRRSLCSVYEKIGNLLESEGYKDSALDYYEDILEIYEIMSDEINDDKVKRDLSESNLRIGDFYAEDKDFKHARHFYEKSMAIEEALVSSKTAASDCLCLSDIYQKIGNVIIRGRLEEKNTDSGNDVNQKTSEEVAETFFQKSLQTLELISERNQLM